MPKIKIIETATVVGVSYPATTEIEAEGAAIREVTIGAAKSGQLTTRTNDTSGTLTMAGGHGITTGARLDLYWAGGCRRGITVGTVATNSVPFSGGAGDNLPTNMTTITAMVPQEEEFVCTGDDVVALAFTGSARGQITLTESDDGEATAAVIDGSNVKSHFWTPARNPTNPVASADIAKAYFSQASTTGSATFKATALFN